jgi:hypothetical protein
MRQLAALPSSNLRLSFFAALPGSAAIIPFVHSR